MSTFVESVDVKVPVSTAYNQWTQFQTFPEFMEGVEQVEQISDTRTAWTTKVGGQTRTFNAAITEQHPDERIAWASEDGPKHAGVVTFHRIDDATSRVTAQMDIDPEGFAEAAADKLGIIERRVKGDMQRFKTYIERTGSEDGAWRGDVDAPPQHG